MTGSDSSSRPKNDTPAPEKTTAEGAAEDRAYRNMDDDAGGAPGSDGNESGGADPSFRNMDDDAGGATPADAP